MSSRLFSQFAKQWSSLSSAQRVASLSTFGVTAMASGGAVTPALQSTEQLVTPQPTSIQSSPKPATDLPFSLFPTAHASQPSYQHLPPPPPPMQPLTAFQMNGRLYPDYETYMLSEGFLLTPYQRRSFDKRAPYALVGGFGLITALYQAGSRSDKYAHAVEQFYHKHMALSYDNRKRPWVYLTSVCTHHNLPHLFANCLAFISFAPNVGVVSAPAFLGLFTTLALSSSILSLGLTTFLAHFLLKNGKARPSLLTPSVGASGAICGMLMISALSDPSSMVSILGLTPAFNILTGLAAFMTLDLAGLIAQTMGKSSGFSHSGHLAGYASGLLLYNLAKAQFDTKYPAQNHAKYGNWLEQSLIPTKPNVVYKQ